jgi:putative membrane protein
MSNLEDPRVLFAAERTLLAWNRTSLALSAFGFMIERSGVLIRVLRPDSLTTPEMFTFLVGLMFILLGAFCAFYSAVQYGAVLRTMTSEEIPHGYSIRWGMLVNGVVAILATVLALVLGVYARP